MVRREKMKLKKADEMEMAINYQSIRLSYLFVTISLFTWMILKSLKTEVFPTPYLLLLLFKYHILWQQAIFDKKDDQWHQ